MLDADAKRSRAAPGASPQRDMIWIPGGTFRMGSDRHYVESLVPDLARQIFCDSPVAFLGRD